MMRRRRDLAKRIFAATFLLAASSAADEPTKQQCIDADTNAQSFRSAGQLAAARDVLRVCSSPSCPQVVRKDCTERLDEVDRVQPTLVIAAQDESGNDLSAVKVTIDGKPFVETLEGPALAIDPGAHDFKFESAGKLPVSRHLLLREGEKSRREQIVMKAAPPSAATPVAPIASAPGQSTSEPATSDDQPKLGTQKIIGIAVAGVGVVGVAIGAIFGVSASSAWSSSQSECASATNCTNHAQAISDHDSAVSKGTISTIGFIGGGVLIAGGAVLFFTAPKSSSSPTVGLAPSLGGAILRGTF